VTRVTLGLGSNTDARENLASCLDALLLQFQDLALSSVFCSRADGAGQHSSAAAPYLNMAVSFETDQSLVDLYDFVKQLERKHGRNAVDEEQGRVSLDLDILTFGALTGKHHGLQLPRPQILHSAYVLWPLSQVAGKQRHPQAQANYATLWKNFSGDRSDIKPVDFEWHGRRLSSQDRAHP